MPRTYTDDELDSHRAINPDELADNQSVQQCFHYHSVGHRCGSPAMRNEYFCYHHRNSLKPTPIVVLPTAPFELPRLKDRASILTVADEIAYRVAANSIDLRRARLVLSALYLAASHLPPEPPQPPTLQSHVQTQTVIEIEIEPALEPPVLNPALEAPSETPREFDAITCESAITPTTYPRCRQRIRNAEQVS